MTFSRLWTFLAIALPVLAGLLASLSAVDLAYHLRAGAEVLDTGAIPTTDTWTLTAAGTPWLNQQWLSQVILAAVHRAGGFELLVVFRAALIGLTFGLVLLAIRRRGAAPRAAALLTLGAFGLSAAALGLRPQLFGMLLFAVVLLLVADRHDHPRRLWLVPLLVALWANLHGSFFLGPLIVGIAWLEARHERQAGADRLLVVAAISAAAALLNPFGFGVWSYAVGLSTNPEVTSRISEWQPTTLRTPLGIAFFASALAVAVFLARRPRVASWPTLLWLGILFAIGAYAVRGVAWWPIGAAVVVAGLLAPPAATRPERPNRLNVALAGMLVIAAVVLLPYFRPSDPATGRSPLLLEAPADATAWLRDNAPADARVFHPQPWGSWIEYDAPHVLTFVDSRIEVFAPDVWEDYGAVTDGRDGWPAVLDRWDVSIVVADDRLAGLGDRLENADGWRRVHVGRDFRIFVRA
jgi:hypothetical protein